MNSENLLVVFVKNINLGQVKTRLAKTVGHQSAFEVYKRLVEITEKETSLVQGCDVHVYFSDVVIDEMWPGVTKFVQQGEDLGARMQNAFRKGFEMGYSRVIGVGSDLPDLTAEIVQEAFDQLVTHQTVFGPSEDGGYYLTGMTQMIDCIFENKLWSTTTLLDETTKELDALNYSTRLLKVLNDVDTIEDLKNSSVATEFEHLWGKML